MTKCVPLGVGHRLIRHSPAGGLGRNAVTTGPIATNNMRFRESLAHRCDLGRQLIDSQPRILAAASSFIRGTTAFQKSVAFRSPRATMKFFPTSSLDKIEPLDPFVQATNWAQFRGQFRSSRSQSSGYRNSSQAATALNADTSNWDKSSVATNGQANPFSMPIPSATCSLPSSSVDVCFGGPSLEFLFQNVSRNAPVELKVESDQFDLELSLLESVQEIAASLACTSIRRVNQDSLPS